MDKTLKNSGEKIFSGGNRVPQNPLFGLKGGFWRPLSPPKNIFSTNFQRFIDLFGLSAFQHAFTRYFTLTLSCFMTFFIKWGVLFENIGIFYTVYKCGDIQKCR